MQLIIWDKNLELNVFRTHAVLYIQLRAHSHRQPYLGTVEKVEDFFSEHCLELGSFWVNRLCQPSFLCCCSLLSLMAYLAALPLYFFLFIYIPVVSSEHFALQALGICRSCSEILQSERKKRSLLPQAVQNASKHAQNTANSSLTVTTVVLLSQYQT